MPNHTRPCLIAACKRPRSTRGLCSPHYSHHHKMGTLDTVALPTTQRSTNQTKRKRGDRFETKEGYIDVVVNDFGRCVPEHRLIMADLLGRPLVKGETVHHINGVRNDNRVENLELWHSPQPYGQRVAQLFDYFTTAQRQMLIDAGWTPPATEEKP